MWKLAVCAFTAMTMAGASPGYAQQRPTAEDIPYLANARAAGLKAGLALTAEQEALWPAVATAMREFGKSRFDLMYGASGDLQQNTAIDFERQRSVKMEATAHALKNLADAEDALYQTLDDGQKRRFNIIKRGMIETNLRSSGR
jgi:hypothetical protein